MVSYARARGEALGADVRVGTMQRPERLFYLGFVLAHSPIWEAVRPTARGLPLHPPAIAALALLFSCGGDVALMLPDTKGSLFLVGLSSFLVAQILFAVGFLIQPHGSLLACLMVMLLVAGGPSAVVLRSVRRSSPEVLGPVAVYVAAITLMAASAIAVGWHDPARRVAAIVGGLSFVASDLLLAVNRFVRPLRYESLIVHVTYHVALFGLTIGILALS